MSPDVGWALQKALYQHLDGALSVPVYGVVPSDAAYPYVEIGDENGDDLSTHTETATDRVLMLHVWSSQPSKSEVYQILGELKAAVHRQRLSLDSGRLWDLQYRSHQITRDLDGKTFTGRMTVRARTQE